MEVQDGVLGGVSRCKKEVGRKLEPPTEVNSDRVNSEMAHSKVL